MRKFIKYLKTNFRLSIQYRRAKFDIEIQLDNKFNELSNNFDLQNEQTVETMEKNL